MIFCDIISKKQKREKMEQKIQVPKIKNARFIKLVRVFILDKNHNIILPTALLKHDQYRAIFVDENGKFFGVSPNAKIDERDTFAKYDSFAEMKEKMYNYALLRVQCRKIGYILDPDENLDESEAQ